MKRQLHLAYLSDCSKEDSLTVTFNGKRAIVFTLDAFKRSK